MKKKITLHRETLRQLSPSSLKGIQGGTGVTTIDGPQDTQKSVCADNLTGVDPNG